MQILEQEGRVRSLAHAPDGRRLAAGVSSRAKLWDRETSVTETLYRGHWAVDAVAFSPDGTLLAWGIEGCGYPLEVAAAVAIWEVSGRRLVHTLSGTNRSITSLAFDPTGQLLFASFERPAAGSAYPAEARCWETATGRERTDVWGDWGWIDNRSGRAHCVSSLAFSPDGTVLAVGSVYALLFLLGWPDGKERMSLAAGAVRAMAFSPDGSLLATLVRSNRVSLWDFTSRRRPKEHRAHRGQVLCAAFAPDGKLLVTGSKDGTVLLWDVIAWRERARYDWGIGMVGAVGFAPDGMTLAAGGDNGLVLCDLDGV